MALKALKKKAAKAAPVVKAPEAPAMSSREKSDAKALAKNKLINSFPINARRARKNAAR
jgi:hypothetical protein